MNDTISSAVRFWEKMQERVRKMEEEEARLMKEACRDPRAAQHFRKPRPKGNYGKGVIPREKWVEGGLRITQEAMHVIAEYAKAKGAKESWYEGRNHYARKAGTSTAVINRYAKMMNEGKVFLDPEDRQWKLSPVQS
jgi:hypothetical protein